VTTRRIKSTEKLPRVYMPGDPRAERGSRLGAVRTRRAEEAAVAAQAAAEEATEATSTGLVFEDFYGTSFPAAPTNGRLFVRTDLDHDLFVWDSTREKWLSARTIVPTFTNGTTLAATNVMRLFQGPAGTSTLGFRMPWDATIIEVVGTRATSGSATQLDVRTGTTVVHSHTIGSGVVTATETAVDVDVAADDIVNVLVNSDLTGGGTISVVMRRRAS
jgi:hypothetical protein